MLVKFRHLLLVLGYLLAWSLPMVHNALVERERAEHRICLAERHAEVDCCADALHRSCKHHGHNEEHCAICQQNSFSQQIVLEQSISVHLADADRSFISLEETASHPTLLRHSVHPRAP